MEALKAVEESEAEKDEVGEEEVEEDEAVISFKIKLKTCMKR